MRNLIAQPELGYRVVGFLDDDPAKSGADIGPIRALGTLDALPEAIAAERHRTGHHHPALAVPPQGHPPGDRSRAVRRACPGGARPVPTQPGRRGRRSDQRHSADQRQGQRADGLQQDPEAGGRSAHRGHGARAHLAAVGPRSHWPSSSIRPARSCSARNAWGCTASRSRCSSSARCMSMPRNSWKSCASATKLPVRCSRFEDDPRSDPRWPLHPPDQPGRAAAVHQRPCGRDEHGGPAAGSGQRGRPIPGLAPQAPGGAARESPGCGR